MTDTPTDVATAKAGPWYKSLGLRKVVVFGSVFAANIAVSSLLLWFGKIDGAAWTAYNKASTYLVGITFGGANAAEHISKMIGAKK